MKKLYFNEYYKTKKSKFFWYFSLYIIIISIIIANTGYVENGKGIFVFITGNVFITLPFYISFIFSFNIISDYHSGYNNEVIAFGYSRKELIYVIIHSFAIKVLLILMQFILVLFIITSIKTGYGNVTRSNEAVYVLICFIILVMHFILVGQIAGVVALFTKSIRILLMGLVMINFLVMLPMHNDTMNGFYRWTMFGVIYNLSPQTIMAADLFRIAIVYIYTFCIIKLLMNSQMKRMEFS